MVRSFSGFLALLVSTIYLSFSCSITEESGKNHPVDLSVKQAAEMIDSDQRPVIVDVRTPPEFYGEIGHIPGARLIPLQNLNDSLGVFFSLESRKILLVCRSGRRSRIAGEELLRAGFDNIYNLAGGMIAWNDNGGKVEKDNP